MANPVQSLQSPDGPAPTLPRLLAIKQNQADLDNLDDQIREVAQIIGLPADWETLPRESRASITPKLVLARADFVLRWVLEKLRDATENGPRARANVGAWKLLDWMIRALPISRCAPTLRDSQFLSVLEKTLEESYGADVLTQPSSACEPSRKRKRGTSSSNSPSKRTDLEAHKPTQLFDVVVAVIQTIRHKAEAHGANAGFAQAEHMKMVLKTESAQAARIVKYWLSAVQQLTSVSTISPNETHLDLGPVLEIWELRSIDSRDSSGASSEDFATECLIPALVLSTTLQGLATLDIPSLRQATVVLDRLIAQHVIAPARVAFLNRPDTAPTEEAEGLSLATNLSPLRAKLLQAAQIEDSGEPIPSSFRALFAAIPQLLDLALRSSPARSRKSRVAEKPWIQAAFVALAECVGCALEAPEFRTPEASIDALRECLRILASHDVSIDAHVLKDIFWFHSGFKYPLKQTRSVHWSLIASMVELDPDIFLADSRSTWHNTGDKPEDLTNYLFDQISTTAFEHGDVTDDDKMDTDEQQDIISVVSGLSKDDVVETIIVPIISAFARNRDLLGFMSRWDDQLCKTAKTARHMLQEPTASIWRDRQLSRALATHFEQSLTISQIANLFREHAERLKSSLKSKKNARNESLSSTVIIDAMLLSVNSDESVMTLKPHLLSLWSSYTSWAQNDSSKPIASLGVAWSALSQLLVLLWPIHLHTLSQEEVLYPLVEQASKDVSSMPKDDGARRVDSKSRAASLVFLLTACDYLRSILDTRELIQKRLRRALKSLSSSQLEIQELTTTMEIFCSEYAQLLETFEPETCQAQLSSLLSTVSMLEQKDVDAITNALAQSVFTHGSASFQASYAAALLVALTQDNERLHTVAVTSLLQITPSSISRVQREAILDRIVTLLTSQPRDVNTLLSIMVHLMTAANATARISSDASALFDLAQTLHDAKLEKTSLLQLLRELAQLTLTHIIPNQNQTQNKLFLEAYKIQITTATKKARKCFPARLAILRGTFRAANGPDSLLPMDQYIAFLLALLRDEPISGEYILEAFDDIPPQMLKDHSDIFHTAQEALRKWTTANLSSDGALSSLDEVTFTSLPKQLWPTLYCTIAQYQLCPTNEHFLGFSSDLLRKCLPADSTKSILTSMADSFARLDTASKLALLPYCMPSDDDEDPIVSCRILYQLISTFENKQEADPGLKLQQLAVLPKICLLLENSTNDRVFNTLLDIIIAILRNKPSLTSQHGVECLLVALSKVTSRNSPRLSAAQAPAIFTRLCETARLLLMLQRGRIGGRFHLLLPLLQNLLLCLFIPNAGRGAALPPWLDSFATSQPVRLTPANASAYTRLLRTLCSPTQSSVQRHYSRSQTSKKELNDPVKAARDYASQYMYALLSSFCLYQLYGRLEPQVREKLMPGIWEVVEVGSLDRQSLDAMFEGLGKSEQDIWRGIWRDWEREHGRKDRKEVV
ncbi:hypothetical protein P280DRAFT_544877 [Massarina eburnea CBS 473.64]|uniref:Nucleolar 27S pre-rRNA processing Urb2/Npa2 C-terminal domain-containing protein n=1 Tax=Massarina eburnea CBS 473.64 TaxID=1395130 RepID=A0A6A6SHW0_9PLEO|nr:hypothetical protein P280DRAFT_544877 [Massarina eburnea CBS 473.64]